MERRMKICMVTPEFTPFAKAGGLGDCVASLSRFIANLGHEVKVVMPKYGHLNWPQNVTEHLQPMTINLGYGAEYCKIWEYMDGNLSVYFVEFDRYFNRHGIYNDALGDFRDNPERFAFLSRAALDLCYYLNWIPDVFHCHDWTSGLLPVMLDTVERERPLGQSGSVFTIHNLQHHGYAPKNILSFLGIPEHVFRADGVEAFGQVNSMKAALYFSKKITTVSPTYAQEIQTPQFGFGLDSLLKFKAADLIGILNGIDTSVWDPSVDTYIPCLFSVKNLQGKSTCKKTLQEFCHLPCEPQTPVFAVISRLYEQKGIDILAQIIPELLRNMHIQICILGSGDHSLENQLTSLSHQFPRQLYTFIGFEEELSHLIEAGSDFFIMPSRFEPCGLTQMYSMRYGSIPIVHAVGGLNDTVQNFSEKNSTGTGFVFQDLTPSALYNTIGWACHTYYEHRAQYRMLQKNAMQQNFSWEKSAQQYIQVYHWAKG